MPRIRLDPTASIAATRAGVILRSDLGTFQIAGAHASAFVGEVAPLLDGSRDREAVVEALAGYSRSSVAAFLDLLARRGLLETVPEGAARWRGPEAFLRTWSAAPGDAMPRLAQARVLLVGLEPWGATAAIELAAAGLGALHVIDDGAVQPEDAALIRARGETALGAPRREVVAAMIGVQAPWCRVEQSPMEALGSADITAASGPWSLLVATLPPGDAPLVERVARLAHRGEIVSLWSHLAGATGVLGPLVTPGRTACRICATVDALNPPLAERARPALPPRADAMGQLLGHMVAMHAIQLISEYAPSMLGGRLLMEDFTRLETSLHTLVRLPGCRVCGVGSPRPGEESQRR